MAKTTNEPTKIDRSEFFASIVSYVLHPGVAFLLASYTLIHHYGIQVSDYALITAPFALLTLFYIILAVFIEKKTDLDFTDVKTRPPLFLTASIGLLISIILARFLLPEINLVLERILIIFIMTGIISMYWKISVHAISFSIAVFIAVKYLSVWYLLLFLLLPVLYWSRIHLRKHQLLQLIVGSIISGIILI